MSFVAVSTKDGFVGEVAARAVKREAEPVDDGEFAVVCADMKPVQPRSNIKGGSINNVIKDDFVPNATTIPLLVQDKARFGGLRLTILKRKRGKWLRMSRWRGPVRPL